MTIGPEPMMRMLWMSVATGHHTPAFAAGALASISSANMPNRYRLSCGPGPGLGVVLHAERRRAEHPHALVGEVVEVEVGHLHLARRGWRGRRRSCGSGW